MGFASTLHCTKPNLSVTYESLGISDPAASRTEAIAVLSALLKAHPELRESFHGAVGGGIEGWKAYAGDGTADRSDTVEQVRVRSSHFAADGGQEAGLARDILKRLFSD